MEFSYNNEVIKKAEIRDGWLVLSFREPHPILDEERQSGATDKETQGK